MELKLNKEMLLGIFLLLVFIFGIVMRVFPLNQGDFSRDSPPNLNSNDVFWHTLLPRVVQDTEQIKYLPSYFTHGIEKVLFHYPSLFYVFSGSFSQLTLVPSYQVSYLFICIFSVLISFYAFLLVRRAFGSLVASIVLALGVFCSSVFLFQIDIGFWADLMAFLFISLSVLLLMEFLKRKNLVAPALIAFLFASAMAAHMWEAAYILYFIGINILFILFYGIKKNHLLRLALFFVVFVLLICPFAYFTGSFSGQSSGWFVPGKVWQPNDYMPKIPTPWYFLLFSAIGIVFGIYTLYKKGKEMDHWQFLALSFSLTIFIHAMSRFVGFSGGQTTRQLFHGLSFLLIPFALGVYTVSSLIGNALKSKWVAPALIIILVGALAYLNYSETYKYLSLFDMYSFSDDTEFEAVRWIQANTSPDSKIFTLYGFEHGLGRLYKRPSFSSDTSDSKAGENLYPICNKTIPNQYYALAHLMGLYNRQEKGYKVIDESGKISFKSDSFVDEYYLDDQRAYYFPLTYFDYVVLQYAPDPRYATDQDPYVCMIFYANTMIQENKTRLVWKNDKMAILKVIK